MRVCKISNRTMSQIITATRSRRLRRIIQRPGYYEDRLEELGDYYGFLKTLKEKEFMQDWSKPGSFAFERWALIGKRMERIESKMHWYIYKMYSLREDGNK